MKKARNYYNSWYWKSIGLTRDDWDRWNEGMQRLWARLATERGQLRAAVFIRCGKSKRAGDVREHKRWDRQTGRVSMQKSAEQKAENRAKRARDNERYSSTVLKIEADLRQSGYILHKIVRIVGRSRYFPNIQYTSTQCALAHAHPHSMGMVAGVSIIQCFPSNADACVCDSY